MADSKVIWLIEDNKDEAEKYKRFLEKADGIKVKTLRASDHTALSDYNQIATSSSTGAVLIDQRLDMSGVSYSGIDVARYLRQIRPKLVIYMLTGYPQDVEGAGEVEDVIPKSELRRVAPEYVARILRSMQRYEEALTDRQKRLNELIDRKLGGKLTKSEETELQMLRQEIERPFASEIFDAESNIKDQEANEQMILKRISDRLDQIQKSTNKSLTPKKESAQTKKSISPKRKTKRG